MPRHSTTCTVHNIKDPAWELKALRTHDSGYCRYSSFKGKLNLSLMFIFGCKRHCNNISVEKITPKAGNTAANVQNDSSLLPPSDGRYWLQSPIQDYGPCHCQGRKHKYAQVNCQLEQFQRPLLGRKTIIFIILSFFFFLFNFQTKILSHTLFIPHSF